MTPGDPPRDTSPVGHDVVADPLIGAVLDGRYRISGPLGSGGVADVYRGETFGVARKVAIKVLQEDFGANENLRGRFEREARALASLSHPHIVTMIDYGVTEGMPYLVMELLEGRTLRDLMDDGPLPSERAFAITRQIVRALVFAHEQGLVHRDLKPANVFLLDLPGNADHVKILDFGFAKFLVGDEDGPVLTRTGMVFGTPPYMAPEQVSGGTIDGRCDVYATAVMLYEMFADRRPFEGETQDLLRSKLTEAAPRLSEVAPQLTIRPELDDLLACALAQDPTDRFASSVAFGEALDAVPQPAVWGRGSWDSLVGDAPPAPGATPAPAPPAGRAPPAPRAASGTPWRLLAGAAAAAFLVVGLVCAGALTWWLTRDGGDASARDTAAAPALPSGPEPADPAGGNDALHLAVANPWDAPAPAPLAEALQAFRDNGDLSNAELRNVRQLARQHPEDPRPHLLSGHVYFARRWRSDAIERYQLAHQVSDHAAGDPRMLVNLVVMAAAPAPLGPRAAEALRVMYGPRALGAVDRALTNGSLDARERRQLEAVREDLTR
jgi:eukaryotic-like serine/threonine-protein kinase